MKLCSGFRPALDVRSPEVVQLKRGRELAMDRVSQPIHYPHRPCIPTRTPGWHPPSRKRLQRRDTDGGEPLKALAAYAPPTIASLVTTQAITPP